MSNYHLQNTKNNLENNISKLTNVRKIRELNFQRDLLVNIINSRKYKYSNPVP
jgi:hypothetical protein